MGSMHDVEDISLPPGAWDSHVHVVDEDVFPLHPLHPYRPKKADLSDLLSFHQKLGIAHSCLVAFSVYHTDNSSILDALRRLRGKARAVVCIDPDAATDSELQELHDAGARAIRLNLKTCGQRLDKAGFEEMLRKNAARIAPFGWAVQMYVSLDQIAQVADVLPTLGVPVVIDHVGFPDPAKGPVQLQEGYREFMDLLKSGAVWTKLSGTYRFQDLVGLDDYVREILSAAPDRVVWASDWPHSGGVAANPGGDRDVPQEYRKIDDRAWVARCKTWCREVEGGSGQKLVQKIWVDNPRRLWKYESDD
ncbi:amidohydrolase 2 [Coniochaeta ligniaria NRRL 30616]|uniref:Amidohydrolase 2 n=1 Tax=Coniochaeta ligniaria NRRL 30616 TaxID=1408157 RepID=A0A1J7IXB5_9PEZI|nr:amidohydrolase 2 [Coniochaeta ligniaria NRRL 30616]